jgi:hypothetical protein
VRAFRPMYLAAPKLSIMKKLLTLAFACGLGFNAFATVSADDFSYDAVAFETEMTSLNQLEQDVKLHGFSLTEAKTSEKWNNELAGLGLQHASWSIQDMDWGSFAWGFCCWPVGFFVVAINPNKSNDQKLSFWIGLVTNAVVGAITVVSSPEAFNFTTP